MTNIRIVVEMPCEHGWTTRHSINRSSFYNERPCLGGSRRVLASDEVHRVLDVLSERKAEDPK